MIRRIRGGLQAIGVLAVPAALAQLGLPAVVAIAAAVLAVAGLLCWVLASDGPADRLAKLITAVRGMPSPAAPPPTALPAAPAPPSGLTRSRRLQRWGRTTGQDRSPR